MNNRRIVLASRPAGEASSANFRLETVQTPALAEGQVLVRHHWLSLDPYMRMRMNDMKSYAPPVAVGAVMMAGTAGVVAESRNAAFETGDTVVGQGGWQEWSVVDAPEKGALRKVDTTHVPLSAYLGAVGMPGVTAWIGLVHFIEPKAGETIVVDAASGAVGGVVGQLAKARGCRAVGLAGGADKCAYVKEELGFDACIDHKAHRDFASLAAALDRVAPNGVDGLFENVGGLILDVVLSRMNAFGRITLCGMIASYDGAPMPITNPRLLLTQRLRLQGFIVSEHMHLWPQALAELGEGVATRRIKYRETVAQGLENAPEAFLGLLKGRNFGKQLVKLA
ncbi:MAG: NADP-dependent oxidoreductase [Proteobacteria bacterium]|nr:NADP-dependent oxidoreductase [Pseudomonadota bacterium]